MISVAEVVHLIVVGAFWGCTNPFLRRAAASTEEPKQQGGEDQESSTSTSTISILLASVEKLRNWKLWVPYLLNQCGSVLYYLLLSDSDLSLAVPICNALALVFSVLTSFFWLGETVNKPFQAVLGASLVLLGVTVCLHSRQKDNVVVVESRSGEEL